MTATARRDEPIALPRKREDAQPDVRPAPRREPPFDDELAPGRLHAVGPLDQPLPFSTRGRGSRPRRAPDPLLPRTLPDPAGWGRRLLVGISEAAAGRRPLPQLSALLSPGVAAGLSADFERTSRANRRHWTHACTVRRVHASIPAEGVAELNATVQAGRRVHAVALRLEERSGRWLCTKLTLG